MCIRDRGYDDIYDPDYADMLRVSFMHQFRRGKLADLVSLLSGRDFESKEYRDDVVAESYRKLDLGIQNYINEYNFAQFILAIKGAGFISHKLLNSYMTLDFAYTLYLILLDDHTIPNAQIKRYVQKWFVMSTLTSRYIGSPETVMDRDMRSIADKGFLGFLDEVEDVYKRQAVTGISLYRDIPVICVTAVTAYEFNQPALSRPLGTVLDSSGLQHLIVKLP